jgi:hypothetical protein
MRQGRHRLPVEMWLREGRGFAMFTGFTMV